MWLCKGRCKTVLSWYTNCTGTAILVSIKYPVKCYSIYLNSPNCKLEVLLIKIPWFVTPKILLLIVSDLFFGFSLYFLMPFYSYFLCWYILPKYSLNIYQNTSVIFKKWSIFLTLFLHVRKVPANEKQAPKWLTYAACFQQEHEHISNLGLCLQK